MTNPSTANALNIYSGGIMASADAASADKLLAAALVAFQASAPAIAKTRTAKIPTKNGGSYSYKYADLADIWDALREPLAACGLAVTQELTGGSNGFTGIRTTVRHEGGGRTSTTVEVETKGRSPQEIGSQITYFKRYALTAALGLSTEEDDDGNSAQHALSRVAAEPPTVSLERAKEILRNAITDTGADPGPFAWVAEATAEDAARIVDLAAAVRAAGPVVSG